MTASSESRVVPEDVQPVAAQQSVEEWRAQFRGRVLNGLRASLAPYEDGQAQTLNPQLQPWVSQLQTLRQKLTQGALQIAVFGYVSRGKSALLNGLLGEPILPIGALNGVTQWPRSVQWTPFPEAAVPWKIELVDTPGLGEVDGRDRADMAMNVAGASDLLLFVSAGPPNAEEVKTLMQLAQTQVPLLLVANKADLFPDLTPESLWSELGDTLKAQIQPEDILLAAAKPAARQVRHEWPDGRVTEEWEVPPTNVCAVRDRLKTYLMQEAFEAVMQNVLGQTVRIQRELAQLAADHHMPVAISQWQRYGTAKSAAVALLPFWWLDAPVNLVMDLLLVRSLVNLYQLPTHRHQVEDLWRALFFSLFGVLLCDMASGVGLGIGSAVGGGLWNVGGVLLWGGTAALQFLAASYGSRKVFEMTNAYLVDGATWSPQGASQLLAELAQVTDRTAQMTDI